MFLVDEFRDKVSHHDSTKIKKEEWIKRINKKLDDNRSAASLQWNEIKIKRPRLRRFSLPGGSPLWPAWRARWPTSSGRPAKRPGDSWTSVDCLAPSMWSFGQIRLPSSHKLRGFLANFINTLSSKYVHTKKFLHAEVQCFSFFWVLHLSWQW